MGFAHPARPAVGASWDRHFHATLVPGEQERNLKLDAGKPYVWRTVGAFDKTLRCVRDTQFSHTPGKSPRLHCFFLRPCTSVCGTKCQEWVKLIVLGVTSLFWLVYKEWVSQISYVKVCSSKV